MGLSPERKGKARREPGGPSWLRTQIIERLLVTLRSSQPRNPVGGHGTWKVWDGTLDARLGGRPIADLTLGVREGRYTLSGRASPSQLLSGKTQRLTAPSVAIAASGTLARRQLTGQIRLQSPALRMRAKLDTTCEPSNLVDMALRAIRARR